MYDIIKSVIVSGVYELSDMLKKIDTVWLQGDISDEQRTELMEMARENADPTKSYAPLQKQIDTLFGLVSDLTTRVSTIENGGEQPDEPVEEYPEYVQPTGSHDAYKKGDKVTYKGKHYECLVDGCVWSPEAYPQGWKEISE